MRDREIVIDRVCARCGCEYEWGVHVAYFAGRVGLTIAQVASLTFGGSDDPCWTDEREPAAHCDGRRPARSQRHRRRDCGGAWPHTSTSASCSICCCCPAGTTPSATSPAPRASISNRARRASATSGAEPHDLRRPPSLPMMRRMPNGSVVDRQSVAALHHRLLAELAGPGDWWDGASRRAIMEESRAARRCARCRRGGVRERVRHTHRRAAGRCGRGHPPRRQRLREPRRGRGPRSRSTSSVTPATPSSSA